MPSAAQDLAAQAAMGANLVGTGATFRCWAPGAREVHIIGNFNDWQHTPSSKLYKDQAGYWSGFVEGVKEGDEYKFYIIGHGSEGGQARSLRA